MEILNKIELIKEKNKKIYKKKLRKCQILKHLFNHSITLI